MHIQCKHDLWAYLISLGLICILTICLTQHAWSQETGNKKQLAQWQIEGAKSAQQDRCPHIRIAAYQIFAKYFFVDRLTKTGVIYLAELLSREDTKIRKEAGFLLMKLGFLPKKYFNLIAGLAKENTNAMMLAHGREPDLFNLQNTGAIRAFAVHTFNSPTQCHGMTT